MPVLRHGAAQQLAAAATLLDALITQRSFWGRALGRPSSTGLQRKHLAFRYVKHLKQLRGLLRSFPAKFSASQNVF